MKKYISQLTDKLFADIPYSKPSEEAKGKVTAALDGRYDHLTGEGLSDVQAMGEVMRIYGTLEDSAKLAELDEKAVSELKSDSEVTTKGRFRHAFRMTQLLAIVIAWFAADIVVFGFQAVYFRSPSYLIGISFCIAIIAALYLIFRKRSKNIGYESIRLAANAMGVFDLYSDRWRKRTVNSFLLLVGGATLFIAPLINCSINTDINYDELSAMIISDMPMISIPLLICIKNALYTVYLSSAVSPEKRKQVKRYIVSSALICGGFAVISAILAYIAEHFFTGSYMFYYLATALFIAVFAVVNLSRRRSVVKQNIRVNKPRIAVFAAAAAVVLVIGFMQRDVYVLTPYIMSVSEVPHAEHAISYDDGTGVYTISADSGDFKILHLTDIHIGGSVSSSAKDFKALNACYKLIEHTQPDLVVITGDMVFPMGIMSLSLNNEAPVMQFANFMRNTGIPWAVTYGNHDTESMATGSREQICALYESLSYKSSGNLLYPYKQPEITGRSNQMIRIENPDGTVRQALFLIDSNDYTGEGINKYDYIHDDQVDWYAENVKALEAEQGRIVPSMAFFHIPLQQYRTAYELYESGSDEVEYHFGEIGETMINPICCSDYPSRFFDTAVELGSTQAMFCGHDHYNNISMTYRGIRLTYGMSIDYLAMPGISHDTKQRGGELITLRPDGSFDLEQIPLTSLS